MTKTARFYYFIFNVVYGRVPKGILLKNRMFFDMLLNNWIPDCVAGMTPVKLSRFARI